jgi:hypothetical protein
VAVSRRVSLPAADDLFRPTDRRPTEELARRRSAAVPARRRTAPTLQRRDAKPSGRGRHDEKMTVYVSSDELLDLEHARLALRRDHGLAVDRGRLVREAVASVLADLEAHGDDSALVPRLREQ